MVPAGFHCVWLPSKATARLNVETLSNFWRSIKWSLLGGTPLSHVSIGASADQIARAVVHAPQHVNVCFRWHLLPGGANFELGFCSSPLDHLRYVSLRFAVGDQLRVQVLSDRQAGKAKARFRLVLGFDIAVCHEQGQRG